MNEQEKKLKRLNDAFRRCFSGKDGKAVLEYLEDTYHMRETTYRGDVQATSFSEGQRTVVLDILDRMEIQTQGDEDER